MSQRLVGGIGCVMRIAQIVRYGLIGGCFIGLFAGAQVVKAPRWWDGWIALAIMPLAVAVLVPSTWPRWAFMWALAFAIYCGCKWLTFWHAPIRSAPRWRQLGYLLLWPGLDAATFLEVRRARSVARPAASEWLFAAAKLGLGLGLLYGVARTIRPDQWYIVGWVGMIGVVMVLHFGAFHLLSCAWRRVGVDARPLMRAPLLSRSLSEFWGRRWNTAFRDLTHRYLFRPLTGRLGARGALFAGFAFSGVVHDAVISVPAGGAYGGPSLFFVLQALGMLFERSALGRAIGLGASWRGWLFTMGMLLAPAPLLFHYPFVEVIVLPFMRAIGAL